MDLYHLKQGLHVVASSWDYHRGAESRVSVRGNFGSFQGAPEQVDVHGGALEGFWRMITGEAHWQRNSIRNPIIQVFHSWMCKRILGRMRETKIIDMEVN
jgi:hypothetical protein